MKGKFYIFDSDALKNFHKRVFFSISVFFFVFITPANITAGGDFGFNYNFNISKECGDEILTANITSIDREALVNITYS